MLRSVFIYMLITVLLSLLIASTSRSAMEQIAKARADAYEWWGTYKGAGGDLANMAYLGSLPEFKAEEISLDRVVHHADDDIALYVRGDSYGRGVPSDCFAFVSNYYFSNRWQTNFGYTLDKSKKNILIIETTERFLQDNYNDLRIFKYFTNEANKNKNTNGNELLADGEPEIGFLDGLFNKNINQNLEYNLFNYRLVAPLFESKAAFNYHVFGRASGDVVVSNDNKFLLLRETMVPAGPRSSFSKVPADQISLLINNLNSINNHYLAEGFDEVIFTLIPNPVSLLQPGNNCNQLIPRIQSDPRLKIKYIDLYKAFSSTPELYYAHGDTHWSNEGKAAWVHEVNRLLAIAHFGLGKKN